MGKLYIRIPLSTRFKTRTINKKTTDRNKEIMGYALALLFSLIFLASLFYSFFHNSSFKPRNVIEEVKILNEVYAKAINENDVDQCKKLSELGVEDVISCISHYYLIQAIKRKDVQQCMYIPERMHQVGCVILFSKHFNESYCDVFKNETLYTWCISFLNTSYS